MASLKEVRSRIQSVNSTQQITKAMKMVAAAKLRRAQDTIMQMRPYAQKLTALLNNLSANIDESLDNKFAAQRPVNNVLIIVITSDRGLCGAFNTNIIKATTILLTEKYKEQVARGQVKLLCVGKKGHDFFSKRNLPIVNDYVGIFQNLNFDNVKHAAEYAMNGFISGEFDQVDLVYNEFKNVATQIVRSEQFLPIPETDEAGQTSVDSNITYIFEPSVNYIIDELIPTSLKIQFYKAVLESNASEQGSRMTAMDKATENAGELLKELKLTYNRTRQAAITKEILEIVGGAEALASS